MQCLGFQPRWCHGSMDMMSCQLLSRPLWSRLKYINTVCQFQFCTDIQGHCRLKKKKNRQTDGHFFVHLSVRIFCFFLTDRQMDEKMSVCLSGIFFFFFGQTDGRKNVRLSVREFFFFFLTDRQTDEKMSVCLSGNFLFFFWRTDRRTKKCPSFLQDRDVTRPWRNKTWRNKTVT